MFVRMCVRSVCENKCVGVRVCEGLCDDQSSQKCSHLDKTKTVGSANVQLTNWSAFCSVSVGYTFGTKNNLSINMNLEL